MDIFGRRKTRQRQTSSSSQDLAESVPYDRLNPSSRSPMPVGTVSQGLRASTTGSTISAPMTNPTLTSDGTELNYYAMQKSRSERDRIYGTNGKLSSRSPLSPAAPSSSNPLTNTDSYGSRTSFSTTTSSSRLRRAEASSSYSRATRPDSIASSQSDSYSNHRASSSVTISDNQSHYSHLFHPRQSTHEEFEFPRPSDEEVEAMFQQLMLKRDIPDVPNLTTEQKWSLVHSDERMRWNAEMQEMKRQTDGQSSKALSKDNPQWYLKKFLDQTITAKHAASLLVSLRTGTMRWVTVSWV